MKKSVIAVFTVLVILGALAGCDSGSIPTEASTVPGTAAPTEAPTSEPTEPPVTYPYDFTSEDIFENEDWAVSVPRVSLIGANGQRVFQVAGSDGFSAHQGSCTDGEYVYVILENKTYADETGSGMAVRIAKINMATWEVVAQSQPLRLDHGNSMCYNPKLDQLVVVHYYESPNDVSFVDPDTLEVVGRKTLDVTVGAIAYNESRDQYVIGMVGNSAPFAILDADFNQIAYHDGNYIGLGTQDVDCDDDYIYVGNSGLTNVVKVYDWNGQYQGIYQTAPLGELESMFNYGGAYYITFATGSAARIYKADYDFSLIRD